MQRMQRIPHLLIKLGSALVGLLIVFTAPAARSQSQFGETVQYFPQFAAGNGWLTTISVLNPTSQPENITLEMFRSDGSTFLKRDVLLNPDETQSLKVDSTAGVLTVGWAK